MANAVADDVRSTVVDSYWPSLYVSACALLAPRCLEFFSLELGVVSIEFAVAPDADFLDRLLLLSPSFDDAAESRLRTKVERLLVCSKPLSSPSRSAQISRLKIL